MARTTFCMLMLGVTLLAVPSIGGAETKSVFTNTKASITPLLELTVPQQGQSELRFGSISPSAIETTQIGPAAITIIVKSNIGEPYQIAQTASGNLENADGGTIGLENLKFKTSALKSNGVGVSSPTPVSPSPQVIFTSDSQGSGDTISIEYVLTVPMAQTPGDYGTNLTYTVSSL